MDFADYGMKALAEYFDCSVREVIDYINTHGIDQEDSDVAMIIGTVPCEDEFAGEGAIISNDRLKPIVEKAIKRATELAETSQSKVLVLRRGYRIVIAAEDIEADVVADAVENGYYIMTTVNSKRGYAMARRGRTNKGKYFYH